MEEGRKYRKFDREFKVEAVKLAVTGGRTVPDVAKSLGVHENQLYRWKRQFTEDMSGSFPGKGHLRPEEAEFKRLQRENDGLKEDNAILKKALAIFSKHRG